MRPRIRTVKPEMRQDERYARLSYPARELFNGLITMADDEGRFRARTSSILGHVFPVDEDAPAHLREWINEIKEQGMILFYVHEEVPYGAFRHWAKHQAINRPTPSELPPPPDKKVIRESRVIHTNTGWKQAARLTEASLKTHGGLNEDSLSPHSPRGSDPNPVLVVFEYWKGRCRKSRAKLTDERRSKVQARLDQGYTVEDIKLGIDGAATNPPQDRDSGVVHDDLVSVCRNGAQLERYMGRATALPPSPAKSNVANLWDKLNDRPVVEAEVVGEEIA